VRSLWRGAVPYNLRHAPAITLSFALKDAARGVLPAAPPGTTAALAADLAAGGAAGLAVIAVGYPFDFANVRLSAAAGPAAGGGGGLSGGGGGGGGLSGGGLLARERGMLDVFRSALRRDGLAGCYRGFGVAAAGAASYKALYFGLYDSAAAAARRREGGPPGLLASSALAAATTSAAATLTFPLDVMKKRLIVDAAAPVRRYAGLADCARDTWAREGLRGFFRRGGGGGCHVSPPTAPPAFRPRAKPPPSPQTLSTPHRFYVPDMSAKLASGLLLVAFDRFGGRRPAHHSSHTTT